MKLKQTKLMLVGAAMAIALPTTLALSQQDRPATPPPGGQQPQQPDRQQDRMNGVQRDQMSPEQSKQAAEKWFKHAASSNQFEIEASRLAIERFGGEGLQPGMRGDQPRQPGTGAGMDQPGQQPRQQPGAGGGAHPAGGAGGQQPGAGGGAHPAGDAGGQQPGAAQPDGGQQPGMAGQDGMQPHQGMPGDQKQQLVQVAQMIQRDHTQALQDLRHRAQQEGVQISESPDLSAVHHAKLDDLREKQGDDFVRAFVFGNMASHTHGILEYTWAQQHGPSQQIKEYARATLPRIQAHAQQIAPIAYEIAGVTDARTAGERMGQEQRDRPNDRGAGTGHTDRPAGGGAGGSERPDGA